MFFFSHIDPYDAAKKCNAFLPNETLSNETELEAFAICLDSQTKFNYTIGFLLLSLVFYLTEFLVLDSKYEPTGLRKKISVSKMLFCIMYYDSFHIFKNLYSSF